MKRRFCIFALFAVHAWGPAPLHADSIPQSRILFFVQTGPLESALNAYRNYAEQQKHHDAELLQQIGLALLTRGAKDDDPEIRLSALFGAGVSMNERTLPILQDGLKSRLPQLQLVALKFLSRYHNDEADEMLNRSLNSTSLLIRLEGAYQLASRKLPKALAQTDSLMNRVDPVLHPLFPQLYAMIGTTDAIRTLRKLLNHPNQQVRIEAILSAAKYGRDDLLPQIRTLASQHAPGQQEACALALGVLKDESSRPRLEALAASNTPAVRLSALAALHRLGSQESPQTIRTLARTGDPFAITLLSDLPDSKEILAELIRHPDIQIRVNATLALLKQKDPRCLNGLLEILVRDSRDLALMKTSSPGKALTAYKVIPSAQQNLQDAAANLELSLHLKEELVAHALELPQEQFLLLALTLFAKQQNDLIPIVVKALETLRTSESVAFLKECQQKAGAPLIRHYCTLALYRLQEPGPYLPSLQAWIKQQQKEALIFRPLVPLEISEAEPTQLTPEETSRLFVEALETLATEESGIDLLLEVIQNGNPKNRYALAGLLLRLAT